MYLFLQHSRNKQTRWIKARNSRPSKQVVVQRLLPLQPGVSQSYDVVTSENPMDFIKLSKLPQDTPRTQIRKYDNNDKKKSTPSVNSNNNNQKDSIILLETSSINSAKQPAPNSRSTRSETTVATCSDTRVESTDLIEDDPGIQSLMDISLPSPGPSANIDECKLYVSVYCS